MLTITVATMLLLHGALGAHLTPLLCDRDTTPSLFRLGQMKTCGQNLGTNKHIKILQDKDMDYKVQGWRIRAWEFTCTSHYFWTGSYAHDEHLKPLHLTDGVSERVSCPEGFVEQSPYSDLAHLCEWSWPSTIRTTTKICSIEKSDLLVHAGTFYVSGLVATCGQQVCRVSDGSIFIHGTPLEKLQKKNVELVFEGPARCTESYCVVHEKMALYHMTGRLDNSTSPHRYQGPGTTVIEVYERSRRTKRSEENLEYLQEKTHAIEENIKSLCALISQQAEMWSVLSQVSATHLARLMLTDSHVVAEMRGDILMVWKCHPAMNMTFSPQMRCTEYPLISFIHTNRSMSGYLDITTGEIVKHSSHTTCRPVFITMSHGILRVFNGTTTLVTAYPPYINLPSKEISPFIPLSQASTPIPQDAIVPLTISDVGTAWDSEDITLWRILHHWTVTNSLSASTLGCMLLVNLFILYRLRHLRNQVESISVKQELLSLVK